jgi:uncharacterized beta-barrel protein YwiB (DUF1934 family)
MTKEVILMISGDLEHQGTGKDRIDLMTQGTLTQLEGALELRYEESAVTGMEGCVTTILVQGPRVTMMRTGEICSQMVFEQGRRHLSVYSTPYGDLEIGVSTSRLDCDLTPCGGSLEIDYSLEIDHALAGFNAFRMQVREKP